MKKHVSSLITYSGKILLLHRDNINTIPDPDTWQSIGGYVGEGENFDEAIAREICEETNLTPMSIKYLGKLTSPDDILALYLVRLTDQEVRSLKLGNEGQEVRFFSVTEMDNLNLSPVVRGFFNKYKEKLIEIINGVELSGRDFNLEA